ncbi:hypothetical protein, partial [Microcystis aeruginosa]|uniref:hypothetical protein n=1 Tax=Microcystis aeruginosa TaxID=1126 RepID=UPI0005C52ED5
EECILKYILPTRPGRAKDIYQKSHEQARGLKTDRVPIIFINKYFTQFIPGKQDGYATTTESLPGEALTGK